MYGLIRNSEREYLQELITDFPPKEAIATDEAFQHLRVRYEALERNISDFVDFINKKKKIKKEGSLSPFIISGDTFPASFFILCQGFHKFLYDNILNNAGEFRSKIDPGAGLIGYGGLQHRVAGKFKYSGTAPSNIIQELIPAFGNLRKNTTEPISAALEFYRRFVRIHPFYDANGRIARLLISIYLFNFNYHINWRAIESNSKNKFIRKLNSCHDREDQDNYKIYFGYFLSFFGAFVTPFEELNKN